MLSEWNSLICKEYTIVDALDVVEITQTERAEKESVVRAETWEREAPVRVMSNFLVSGASSS